MKNLLTITFLLWAFTSHSQLNKLMKGYTKMMGNSTGEIEFYADKALTQPLEKIEDGSMEFYAKAYIDKPAAKLCDNSTRLVMDMVFDNDRNIYRRGEDTGVKLAKVADNPGYWVMNIDFTNEDDASNLLKEFFSEATEKRIYPLTFEMSCPGKNKVLSEGKLDLDLTSGNGKYFDWVMEGQKDFTLADFVEDFKDDDLKQRVINDLSARHRVSVHQFKWGERVPYKGDDGLFYRRHTAIITYTETDGKCYKAGLSVFDASSNPSAYGFEYENDATFSNTEQIPCDRVNM